MGGNYDKDIFNQLSEALEKLDTLQDENTRILRDLRLHTQNESSLLKEIANLTEKVGRLTDEITELKGKLASAEKENQILSEDNERMKRILNNDSNNSSLPPSQAPPGKPANHYNSRVKTGKKQGGQPGHKGNGLSKAEVEEKIQAGIFEHRIENIGEPNGSYITRYVLDIEIRTVAREVRIYADENGKFQVPDNLKADVTYGETLKAMAAFLYSVGVVSIDRIRTFLNSISGDTLSVSAGTVYGACQCFEKACKNEIPAIKDDLLNAYEICSDATTVTTNGKQSYIRNFSTENSVLYCSGDKKDLETLKGYDVLNKFSGVIIHDHETTMYHFGREHGECNVHMIRYLTKNSEETNNTWSSKMIAFLQERNAERNDLIQQGISEFTEAQLSQFSQEFDEILALGFEENKTTEGKFTRGEEKALLNRLTKYKRNHLLFLYDFKIPFSNNMSEKDLRICKNRQKMAGGFRTPDGREMYCAIMSIIETFKRRKQNIFQGIVNLISGKPAFQ